MKSTKKYFPILFFTALAIGVVLGAMLDFPSAGGFSSANTHRNKLNKLIDFIDSEYVDNVDTDSIVNLTVNNILEKLDPHSVYIAREEMEEVSQSMKGDFVGIGIHFYMIKDTIAVIKSVENGPSAKAGIQAGDRILFAGKDKLFGKKISLDSLFSKLKGNVGSEVQLTVFRKKQNKKFNVVVKRDVVPIKSVDVALMLDKTTGYIKINRFAETTYTEFKRGLSSLKKQGAKTLVIDVRDNGGGYLEKAVEIADDFLKKDELIVFTKNRKGRIDKTFATKEGIFETGEVFVLINENSASASEILAGALQDNDRAIIVGRRSFGKGLVQREMDFGDGSAVRLTVARYFTPTGRSIQKSYKEGNEDYFKEFGHRFETGELYSKDSIRVADTIKFKTPKGRIVYGGGGIVPDIFVPLEVQHGQESIAYIMQSPMVGNFVFEQLDKNRSTFEKLTFDQLLDKMEKSDVYFDNFRTYLKKNEIILDLSKNKDLVKRYIMAEFAGQLFGEQKYFEIILKQDVMIKAIMKERGSH